MIVGEARRLPAIRQMFATIDALPETERQKMQQELRTLTKRRDL
jgi:hypothetical protein